MYQRCAHLYPRCESLLIMSHNIYFLLFKLTNLSLGELFYQSDRAEAELQNHIGEGGPIYVARAKSTN